MSATRENAVWIFQEFTTRICRSLSSDYLALWLLQAACCCQTPETANFQTWSAKPDPSEGTACHCECTCVSWTTITSFCFVFSCITFPSKKLPLLQRKWEWDNNGIMEKKKHLSHLLLDNQKARRIREKRCNPVELVTNGLNPIFFLKKETLCIFCLKEKNKIH